MMIKFDCNKYINTDQITHILPNRYDCMESHIYLASGNYIEIKKSDLKKVLEKIKVEEI